MVEVSCGNLRFPWGQRTNCFLWFDQFMSSSTLMFHIHLKIHQTDALTLWKQFMFRGDVIMSPPCAAATGSSSQSPDADALISV